MAEEIRNASTLVPRSIMISIALNGTLGFAMIMAALFSLGDLDAVLKSPTGYPFMEIFHQATKSIAGSAVMASIVVILAISATVGGVATCSRMIFAFARDRGMPGWSILKRVRLIYPNISKTLLMAANRLTPAPQSLYLLSC